MAQESSTGRAGGKRDEPREKARAEPSSRLCVKNIPKYATDKRVRDFFGKLDGVRVTDVRILKTKDGRPRQMAFVGFSDEDEAARAMKYFDRAFFDTCRLTISFALPFGDPRLGRAWSKHSKQKEAADLQKQQQQQQGLKREREEGAAALEASKRKKGSDAKLAEFVKLMQPRSQSQFWANDGELAGAADEEEEEGDEDKNESSDDESSSEDENEKEGKAERSEAGAKESAPHREVPSVDVAADTGRLFVRNLSYNTSEKELEALFAKFGPINEVSIPVDEVQRSRGFGYVLFMFPEHALKALSEVDGQIFQGRLLHVMPALSKPGEEDAGAAADGPAGKGKGGHVSEFKAKKEAERKEKAGDSKNWNSLFIRGDAAVAAVAEQLGVGKADLLLGEGDSDDEGDEKRRAGPSAAVRMALSETRVIAETKSFLADEGVDVELLEQGVRDPASVPRSKVCLLVKNLPADTDATQLRQLFAGFGDVESFVLPPSKTMALLSFYSAKDAKKAFRGLAYKRYKRVPIYLEWAPDMVLKSKGKGKSKSEARGAEDDRTGDNAQPEDAQEAAAVAAEEAASASNGPAVADPHTLFVKNLHFDTREDGLQALVEKVAGKGSVVHVTIPKKRSKTGAELSLGYGFVEFADGKLCRKALRALRGKSLDGHELGVQISQRAVDKDAASKSRRRTGAGELATAEAAAKSTKIVIRNLAFEANKKELMQLVSAYGQVNTIRIPKKFDGTHRGFAFVDFVTHQEAKTAFSALTNTHLYGRHLVIEWAEENNDLETLREKASRQLAGA